MKGDQFCQRVMKRPLVTLLKQFKCRKDTVQQIIVTESRTVFLIFVYLEKCTSTDQNTTTKFTFRPFNNKGKSIQYLYTKNHFPHDVSFVVKEQDSLESNLGFDDAGVHPHIDQVSNFRTLAKHDPVLAQKLANSILKTVAEKGVAINKRDQALLELLTNPDNGIETTMGFMLAFSSNPSTKWLDILCNGQGTSFSSTCNGLFTAQVRLYQQGVDSYRSEV